MTEIELAGDGLVVHVRGMGPSWDLKNRLKFLPSRVVDIGVETPDITVATVRNALEG